MSDQDGTYEACLAYLNAKGYVLWGDYSLNPNNNDDGTPKNRPAARWLEAQVRGVASHYDTPGRTYGAGAGAANRPSALITHGQQAERW